jgi:hypothetical protein
MNGGIEPYGDELSFELSPSTCSGPKFDVSSGRILPVEDTKALFGFWLLGFGIYVLFGICYLEFNTSISVASSDKGHLGLTH